MPHQRSKLTGADGMDFESSNPVALPVDEPLPVEA
jgi:hypothetical protein